MTRTVTGAGRRAPRLDARTLIAPHLTRRGRFAKIDPLVSRPLPSVWKILGVIGWAALLGESLRRSWQRHRGGGD